MKVITYARVSTSRQADEGLSLEAQKRLFSDVAAQRGYELVEEFVEVESAYRPGKRKVFNDMLAYLRAHREIQAVLVYKVDRLTRNVSDAAELIEDLGVQIISISEDFPGGSAGSFMLDMHVSMSKYFSAQISERTRIGMEEKVRAGYYPHAAPFGYQNANGNIQPDPGTAAIVQRIFEMAATGRYSLNELRDAINADIIEAQSEKRRTGLRKSNLSRLLRNPIYKGEVVWNGVTYPGIHEPLVSEALWDAVQDALARRQRSTNPWHHTFAYRGLLRCGYCGLAITAEKKKGKYIYYRCTGYHGPCDQPRYTEAEMGERLKEVVGHVTIPTYQAPLIRDVIQMEAESQDERAKAHRDALKSELEGVEAQLSRAVERQLTTDLPESVNDQASQVITELAERRDSLREEIDRTELVSNRLDEAVGVIEVLTDLQSTYEQADEFQRGQMLSALLWNCEVTRESLQPDWKSPFHHVAEHGDDEGWEALLNNLRTSESYLNIIAELKHAREGVLSGAPAEDP